MKGLQHKYKLKKFIGEGTFGIVVQAKNERKEKVAIKFIMDIFENHLKARSVIREVQILQ